MDYRISLKTIEKVGKILYRSRLEKGKYRKSFVVYSVEEFIKAITQHIREVCQSKRF